MAHAYPVSTGAANARPTGGRSEEAGVLGGVCAGIGRRVGLTPWIARVLFLVLLMVVPGSQLLIYPVLWLVMPSEDQQDCGCRPRRALH